MIELKGMSQDMMKNDFDNATYENEFKDLQIQLYDMTQQTFNGVSLFAHRTETGGQGVFFATPTTAGITSDNTVSVFVSPDGSTGAKVSISKAMLLSALTIHDSNHTSSFFNSADQTTVFSFAATDLSGTMELGDVSVGVFNKALENIAALRARNGGTMSRLNFAADNLSQQKANMEAALGRIVDVDVAAESSRLARNNVLVQASAAMLAQANSTPEIALMLYDNLNQLINNSMITQVSTKSRRYKPESLSVDQNILLNEFKMGLLNLRRSLDRNPKDNTILKRNFEENASNCSSVLKSIQNYSDLYARQIGESDA